ncbi:fibronectin type-III domain-containing protein 3A [Trichonephila clavipes]|nr:fibronectin type-III domain-containing protein 3A [Trichonephila clavipes]
MKHLFVNSAHTTHAKSDLPTLQVILNVGIVAINGSASVNVPPSVTGSAPFYLYHHPSYSIPPQFPPHMQSGLGPQGLHASVDAAQLHQTNGHPTASGMSDTPGYMNSFKDERTQRQFYKLRKRLEARQKDVVLLPHSSNQETSVKINEVVQNETSPLHNTEMDKKLSENESQKLEVLSTIKAPSISDITSTSALLEWEAPELPTEANCDIEITELQYNLLLCDKNQNSKPKVIYSGADTKYQTNDLKPFTSYSAQVQAKLDKLIGSPSESVSFKTLCCKPDTPQSPKLQARTKTSLLLKWNSAVDNGAKITTYILEYDEGTGSDNFVELFNGLQKQFKVSKLKLSTCYRFRLAAVNECGQSDYSGISCFSTSGSAPSQPASPSLKEASVNKLHIEWEERPNDDNYTLQMEDERTLYGFLPVYNGRETSYICLRLTHNTNYKFRLCASNEEGSSPWSQVVTYSTLPDRPSKPGKPCLKGRTHPTFFKMAWDPPKEDGGRPVTEYDLEMDSGEGFKSIYIGKELEHVCEKLLPGKSYSFQVSCSSLGGKSDYSDVGCAVTLPVVPAKCEPPKLHGKPKAISVHLKWTNPDYDGGSEVLGFEVEAFNPDETSRIAYKGENTDCVVAGLLPGRKYKFTVRAYNKIGNGHWSEPFEVTSGAGVPEPPTITQIVPRSPHCVCATWAEPFNNGAIITEYRLESKMNDKEFEVVYSGPLCAAEVKSLIPATVYLFQVQALNSAGAGPFSEPVSCQTPPSSPGAVSTANIKTIVGASTIALSWKEPNNHGSPILSYNIEIGDALHTTDGDNPEICIEGLVPETTHKVRIQAINSVGPGSFSSSIKLVTRGLPPLPPILECVSSSFNSLRLKWGDGKNLDMKNYTLEMESPQSKRFTPVYQGPTHTFKLSKLQELTSYNFRIYASNEEGDGPLSEIFTFTTQRALPAALKAPKVSKITQTSCYVEWLPCKAIGDDMLSYKLQLGTKESDFHVLYTGIQTFFTINNLLAGTEYSVRVAAVRHCSDGELAGPFSPCTAFCTNSVVTVEIQPPKAFSITSSWKNREPLTDQQWAMIILVTFTLPLTSLILFMGEEVILVSICAMCSSKIHLWCCSHLYSVASTTGEANPQVYVETPLHPEKLTVWCVLWANGIIGQYFKNDEGHNVTVNGDRYRAMITNFFIPELNNNDVQDLWFQQDGATCHTARATIDLLKDTFGDRLISRFGPVNWPPRSCDLTPLDYFLWGYVKSLVYADKPQTLDHLEDNIRRVIADIRPQMLEKVIENWTSRLDYIRASRGSPMPEIIFKM